MSITSIDQVTARIVIDLQKGIVGLPLAQPAGPVVANSRKLIDAFRARKLPVVLVNVAGAPAGRTDAPRHDFATFPADFVELIPELDAQPGDLRVTKHGWGAFATTDLAQQLRDRAVTQVVVVGIAISIGVESTARQAHELGFNVTIATDAIADLRADAQENSLAAIFPRIAETGSTAQVIAALEGTR